MFKQETVHDNLDFIYESKAVLGIIEAITHTIIKIFWIAFYQYMVCLCCLLVLVFITTFGKAAKICHHWMIAFLVNNSNTETTTSTNSSSHHIPQFHMPRNQSVNYIDTAWWNGLMPVVKCWSDEGYCSGLLLLQNKLK